MDKRILIYSRKSKFTGKGESIENQIDMCKEYAYRQFGGDIQFFVYEDEGFSGKNTLRPEFQRMMADVRQGGHDVLMCYRLDRISRSVSDFSVILEELQGRGVDFVSIKEQFDTTTPMGRAMIHIASVFAELERETIAERIRDNKYKQYRNGHWQGGVPPVGYASQKMGYTDARGDKRSYQTLQVVPEDAALACMIFEKYMALGSFSKLESYLLVNGIRSPKGNSFTKAGLRRMLANPVYATNTPCVFDYLKAKGADMANDRAEYDGTKGVIAFGKTVTTNPKRGTRAPTGPEAWVVAVSDHPGILEGEKWVEIQTRTEEKKSKFPRQNTSGLALLSTLVRCKKCGSPMEPGGQRIYADGSPGFYYICAKKKVSRATLCRCNNIQGMQFDKAIVEAIKEALQKNGLLALHLEKELNRLKIERGDDKRTVKQIEVKLHANKKRLQRLALKLAASNSSETDALVFQAMRSLQEEEKALQKELENAREKAAASHEDGWSLPLLREAYASFSDTIDRMSIDKKKEVLCKLVKKIEWDGKEAVIYLSAFETSIVPCPVK